jgi:putative oxidoreductase
MFTRIISTSAPSAATLIRLMVGAVFLSEGIQKFLFPGEVGAGRFAKIGLPSPEVLGPVVGGFEIACGTLVLLGLVTRIAVIPLLCIMAVALYSTKLPILVQSGFWKMAHEARTDFSMVMGSLFLLIVGAGAWSLDAWLNRRAAAFSRGGRGGRSPSMAEPTTWRSDGHP